MNLKEGIQKIKELFDAMPAPVVPAPVAPVAPVEAAAKDYTLADGTVVSVDKLEVGGMVTVAGAPAPDAVHTLDNGTTFTTVAGVITELTAAPEEAPTEEAPALLATLKSDFAKQSTDQNKLIAGLTVELAAQKQIVKELFSLVETMGNIEAGAPTEQPTAKAWEQMSALEKRRATK